MTKPILDDLLENRVFEFVCGHCSFEVVVGLVNVLETLTLYCPNCGWSHERKSNPVNTPLWQTEVIRLERDGRHVAAIRHCRNETGWDLRTAKKYCDALRENL